LKRVYHSYEKWEDYKFGMWRKLPVYEEIGFIERAVGFTGDADLYGAFMIAAIIEWPFSCEHNLTCQGMNRQAFIGHSAASIAINSPEYITRQAWWQLTQDQQDKANGKADLAIKIWEEQYAKDTDWNRRIDGSTPADFMDIRHVRESLSIVQCWKGQHNNVALGRGRSEKKEKKVRPTTDRPRRAIQTNDRPCDRLF
jgi:hypothetical protein